MPAIASVTDSKRLRDDPGLVVELSADSGRSRSVSERVLRSLPQWFGLEDAILAYIQEAAVLPTFIASEDDEDIGFLTLRPYESTAAEITAMGIQPNLHRRGYGRALIAAAEAHVRSEGRAILQVKTLGPSHPSEGYARTRAFYRSAGFVPLEETQAFWGASNPCLIMVKPL